LRWLAARHRPLDPLEVVDGAGRRHQRVATALEDDELAAAGHEAAQVGVVRIQHRGEPARGEGAVALGVVVAEVPGRVFEHHVAPEAQHLAKHVVRARARAVVNVVEAGLAAHGVAAQQGLAARGSVAGIEAANGLQLRRGQAGVGLGATAGEHRGVERA
jgi:hypothetical protein